MSNVKENSLEWSLKHLSRYSHSDFFTKIAEFKAIAHIWKVVKSYCLSIDLEHYVPKSPMILIAPKPNGTFRIVHQLDPIDSLMYTYVHLCTPPLFVNYVRQSRTSEFRRRKESRARIESNQT